MPNLFDMLAGSQNGNGINALARQFGISDQQAQAAVEALLPAFSQGLKRNTADPYGVGAFMQALASGQHGQYFDDPTNAFSPQGLADGNGILGHLFGSKDLSRAVAGQAAQATGLGQDMLKQMLPAIAAMLMGGLFKQGTGQAQAAQPAGGFGAGGNIFGEVIDQMMKQGGGMAQPRQPQQPSNPFDNPFGKVLQDMFGGGGGQQSAQPGPNPLGDNPFGKILEEMMKGGLGGAQPQAAEPTPRRDPPENPSGRSRNPYDDIFGDMFESGRKQRDDYQKGVESIFDQFTRGMDRHR
ncbi:MAG: DUF937 domain-containing protein [Rhizobiaceae bacterium]|nr:DUF937 domain-containing protein [Rhizobiaceae bacterium]